MDIKPTRSMNTAFHNPWNDQRRMEFPVCLCLTSQYAFWNVFQRVKNNVARTNNSLEAWNRRFGVLCESSHLPLYRLIMHLRSRPKGSTSSLKKFKALNLNCKNFIG